MSMKFTLLFISLFFTLVISAQKTESKIINNKSFIVILGTLQDGGSPHIGCEKNCCKKTDPNKKVVSLGLIDPVSEKKFIVEATPEITSQIKILNDFAGNTNPINGILLSHAHIGHYSGLMYLGKEAENAKNIPVYTMPAMKIFLENNGPWSQLVNLKNIQLMEIFDKKEFSLSNQLQIIPYQVPHRDEFSETIGFKIIGPNKTALFIPDIDKWEKWRIDIIEMIKTVDYAFIDGTFWDPAELNYRSMAEIPHPLIKESMLKFTNLPSIEKDKIWFIHFNHTNLVLIPNSKEYQELNAKGFHVAKIKQIFFL